MKLVVAGFDFSRAGSAAARRAARIAADAGARLALLHVAPQAAPALDLLQREATRIRAEYAIAVDSHVAKGAPHKEIAAFARASDADLVVLGLRSGFLQDLLGTGTAQRVRRRLDIPVLAVASEPHDAYRRILIATDFSAASARAAKLATRLFPRAAVHLVHVCRPAFDGMLFMSGVTEGAREAHRQQAILQATRDLRRFATRNGLERTVLNVRMGSAAGGIRESARDIGAELVVTAPAARSWLEKLVFFSVTDALLSHADQDALVIEPVASAPAAGLRERTSS
jgi:nucleotide-binding universal stress UspA family protein